MSRTATLRPWLVILNRARPRYLHLAVALSRFIACIETPDYEVLISCEAQANERSDETGATSLGSSKRYLGAVFFKRGEVRAQPEQIVADLCGEAAERRPARCTAEEEK